MKFKTDDNDKLRASKIVYDHIYGRPTKAEEEVDKTTWITQYSFYVKQALNVKRNRVLGSFRDKCKGFMKNNPDYPGGLPDDGLIGKCATRKLNLEIPEQLMVMQFYNEKLLPSIVGTRKWPVAARKYQTISSAKAPGEKEPLFSVNTEAFCVLAYENMRDRVIAQHEYKQRNNIEKLKKAKKTVKKKYGKPSGQTTWVVRQTWDGV